MSSLRALAPLRGRALPRLNNQAPRGGAARATGIGTWTEAVVVVSVTLTLFDVMKMERTVVQVEPRKVMPVEVRMPAAMLPLRKANLKPKPCLRV